MGIFKKRTQCGIWGFRIEGILRVATLGFKPAIFIPIFRSVFIVQGLYQEKIIAGNGGYFRRENTKNRTSMIQTVGYGLGIDGLHLLVVPVWYGEQSQKQQ
jgi:hypothetical protein